MIQVKFVNGPLRGKWMDLASRRSELLVPLLSADLYDAGRDTPTAPAYVVAVYRPLRPSQPPDLTRWLYEFVGVRTCGVR